MAKRKGDDYKAGDVLVAFGESPEGWAAMDGVANSVDNGGTGWDWADMTKPPSCFIEKLDENGQSQASR